jgi:hypothetical protein
MDSKVPFAVQYACRYWFYHLERGSVDPRVHLVADLLETRFFFWVEALALINRLAGGVTTYDPASRDDSDAVLISGSTCPLPSRGPWHLQQLPVSIAHTLYHA